MSGYIVRYKVDGAEERTTEVYEHIGIARQHCDDIAGYERVLYAIVEDAPTCKRCGTPRLVWQTFCGAGCCALWEAGYRDPEEDKKK